MPVRVTHEFDKKACLDPSVGRSFAVDANPPRIEIRITGIIGEMPDFNYGWRAVGEVVGVIAC